MKLFCLSLTYKFKCALCLLTNAFGFISPSSYFALLGVPLPTYSEAPSPICEATSWGPATALEALPSTEPSCVAVLTAETGHQPKVT